MDNYTIRCGSHNYITLEWNDKFIFCLDNEVVQKSKDVLDTEKLCLQGAVHKNDKGQWEQWVDPYSTKIRI